MFTGHVDIVDVVNGDLVNIDRFTSVGLIGFDLQFSCDILGYFDVGELRVRLYVEANFTFIVA